MAETTWPRDRLDRWQELLYRLGTFWQLYHDRPQALEALLRAAALGLRGVRAARDELWACLGRHTTPYRRLEPLRPYDASGSSPSDYPVQDSLRGSALLADDPALPALALARGVDYAQDPATGALTFLEAPPARPDPYWLVWAELDAGLARSRVGRAAGVPLDDSAYSLALANAVLDAVASVPTRADLAGALGALTGAPFAREDGEVVETVFSDRRGWVVATDARAYRLTPGATALVAAGQALRAGQSLSTAVRLYEPGRDALPAPAELPALTLDVGMLDPALGGPLTFENQDRALAVTEGVSGYTEVRWAMPDDAGRVDQFFDAVHARGVAAGKTLADWLDLRPQPQATRPTAASLPAALNPFVLLMETLLRNGALLAVVRTDQLDPAAPGLAQASHLARLVPPWRRLLLAEV